MLYRHLFKINILSLVIDAVPVTLPVRLPVNLVVAVTLVNDALVH